MSPHTPLQREVRKRCGDRHTRRRRHHAGFARRQEFTELDHGDGWAELELRENGATLAQYPFPFRLKVRQELTAEGFASTFTVENTGTDPMPFCLGGHTAFNCPLMPGDRFEDYMICFSERETCGALVSLTYIDVG